MDSKYHNGMFPLEFCYDSFITVSQPIYYFWWIVILISCWLFFAVTAYTCVKYSKQFYFHKNVKVILCAMLLVCIVMEVISLLSMIEKLYNLANYSNYCDVVYTDKQCALYRRLSYGCLIALSTIQGALLTERCYATLYRKNYERTGCKFGVLSTIVAVCMAFLVMSWVMEESIDSNLNTFCLGFTTSSIRIRMYKVLNFLLAYDILLIMVFLLLYRRNFKTRCIETILSEKFQRRENLIVLRSLAPLILIHTLALAVYIVAFLLLRIWKESGVSLRIYKTVGMALYIIPYFPLFIIATCLYAVRCSIKEKKKKMQQTTSMEVQNATKYDYGF